MRSRSCWRRQSALVFSLSAALIPVLPAQIRVLTATTASKVVAQRNNLLTANVSVHLNSGYHVNSNAPNDEYLIPLRLTWNPGPLEVVEISYPKPRQENYSFSEKPVSVFTGDFDIVTKFKAPEKTTPGPAVITGKLRYQACTEASCLPPKTVEVRLPVHIR